MIRQHRFWTIWCAALLACCIMVGTSLRAQMLTVGVGPPTGGAAAGFQGSGDTLAGAYAYWSCARAYTAAYASGGGNACDLVRADLTTCTLKFNSTGFADVTTAYCNGSTQSVTAWCAASAPCVVNKAYDQSGNTNCTTACDQTAVSGGQRPVLNLSGLSSKVCITFGSTNQMNSPALSSGISQPISGSFVGVRTSVAIGTSIGTAAGSVQFLYNTVANQGGPYAGTFGANVTNAISDNVSHAVQYVVNTTSSIMVVDGSAVTGISVGSGTIASADKFSLGNGSQQLNGDICEARIDAIAYNATQYGNLNTNQHGTSGYNF